MFTTAEGEQPIFVSVWCHCRKAEGISTLMLNNPKDIDELVCPTCKHTVHINYRVPE